MRTELCELAAKYGSDKVLYYTPYYSQLLAGRRSTVRKVLEIGIGDDSPVMRANIARTGATSYTVGASLHVWEDYFPHALVYGLDNNPSTLVNSGRIRSFYCDQYDDASYDAVLGEIGSDFDLVVDDGDHTLAAQTKALERLLPLVKRGGLYVVEDLPLCPTAEEQAEYARRLTSRIKVPFELREFGAWPEGARIVVVRP